MADNKNSTQTSSQKQVVTFQYQLLDDLYFSYVNQKEMAKIGALKKSLGKCRTYYTNTNREIFGIYVIRDLEPGIFLKVFCHEFYHYIIHRVVYKWLDPQLTGEVPPLTSFIFEMLCREACWDCQHLGSISCWEHPNNPIQNVIKGTIDVESLEDDALLRLCEETKRHLDNCLFIKNGCGRL